MCRGRDFAPASLEVADSVDTLADGLSALLQPHAYRGLCGVCISGGSLACLLVMQQLRAKAVLAVGPNGPDDPRWNGTNGRSGVSRLLAGHRRHPEMSLAVAIGAEAPADRPAAQRYAELLGATVTVVSDPELGVPHNALAHVLAQNRLPGFLSEHLRLD